MIGKTFCNRGKGEHETSLMIMTTKFYCCNQLLLSVKHVSKYYSPFDDNTNLFIFGVVICRSYGGNGEWILTSSHQTRPYKKSAIIIIIIHHITGTNV